MTDYEHDTNALQADQINPGSPEKGSNKAFVSKPESAFRALAAAQVEPTESSNVAFTKAAIELASSLSSSTSDHHPTSLTTTQRLTSASSNAIITTSTNTNAFPVINLLSISSKAATMEASSSSNAINTDENAINTDENAINTDENAINTGENVNDNDVALSVPTNPKDFAKIFGDEPYKMIVKFAMQLKLRRNPHTPLTAEQTKHLKWILRALSSIDALTPELEKELHLRQSLEVVMGDHIQCREEKTAWQFPDDCIAIALTAHEKYASESWGKNDNLHDDADASDEATTAPAASTTAVTTTLTIPTSHPITLTAIRRAPATHPIYGTTGIMRGIIVDNSGKTRSYKIDDQYPTVPYKVFGNNGLVIGQWWPPQICALRDGAHGMRMAGIAGSKSMGVTSIVVSGLYSTLDTDNGPTLHYSAPQSHNNTTTTPILSAGAKALQTSLGTRRPVRVLRAAGGDSHLCPAVGIRYEGLYTVVGQATGTNAKGGSYWRFRLERVAGQAPVDLSRPTAGEKGEFARVKAGY